MSSITHVFENRESVRKYFIVEEDRETCIYRKFVVSIKTAHRHDDVRHPSSTMTRGRVFSLPLYPLSGL